MEISQSIENALKLCEIDFNQIQQRIEVEYYGSIESYLENVRKLANDFEVALSAAVLIQNQEQINSFAKLNIRRIEVAIKQVETWENILRESEIEIESDPANREIIEGFMRPIYEAHLNQLIYIEKLLKGQFKGNDSDNQLQKFSSETVIEVQQKVSLKNKVDELLNKYDEFLSMSDMEEILKVKRNAVYNYEKEGYFKRCTPKNKTILFKKEEIKNYLSNK